jgi:Domain of unknown function (DUF4874)
LRFHAAGVKVFPRFAYVWNYQIAANDAAENFVIQHLEQLRPFFNDNADVIAFVETGLVDRYGEWHESTSLHVDNFTNEIQPSGLRIRDKLLEVVPSAHDCHALPVLAQNKTLAATARANERIYEKYASTDRTSQ